MPLFQNESKCVNANQSHFHKNGFALRLALKQRHKETRKWPIVSLNIWIQLELRGTHVCFFSVDFFVQQKEMWAMKQHSLTSTDHAVGGMEKPLRKKFKAILLSIF